MKDYFRRVAEGKEHGALVSLLNPFIAFAAAIYGGVNKLNRSLYEKKILKQKRLPFPVISVGNLTWGGTGKTPFVEYLAQKICHRRRTPLVLTRGYSKDEATQFKNHLPKAVIGVGKNRFKVAKRLAKKNKINVAILDDGFQHLPIERDIEIVMVNALEPFGNEKIVPQGILREPLERLSKASIVVISHSNLITKTELNRLKGKIRKLSPKVFIVDTYLEPLFFYRAKKRTRVALSRLQNHRVTTFSGVGAPRSFQLLLSRSQIKPVRNFEFTDHHQFSKKELSEIKSVADSASAAEIITTEKDYYRSPNVIANTLNPLILATRMRVASGEEVLTDRLMRLLGVKHR